MMTLRSEHIMSNVIDHQNIFEKLAEYISRQEALGFDTLYEVASLISIFTEKMGEDKDKAKRILNTKMLDNFLKSVSGYISFDNDFYLDDSAMKVKGEFLTAIFNIMEISDDQTEYGFETVLRTIGYDSLMEAISNQIKG